MVERSHRGTDRLLSRLAGGALLLSVSLGAAFGLSRAVPGTATAAPVRSASTAVSPQLAQGALDYVTFGCENCHGLYGKGGVKVPNISGQASIPALNSTLVSSKLSAASLKVLIQRGVVYQTKSNQVYMPVWGTVLSDVQIGDLVAYIKAGLPPVSGIDPQVVQTGLGTVVEGQQLYIRYGCVVCHAFNGFGGVPNPASPDKTIPPLRGANFDQQFVKDADIAHVIKYGSIIGQAPIASMPVWGGVLSDQQINAIISYIRTFK